MWKLNKWSYARGLNCTGGGQGNDRFSLSKYAVSLPEVH